MNVALVLDGLRVGGIERVCVDYCNIFLELGYKVTIFNLRPNLDDLESEIPQQVHIVDLPFPNWLAPERYAKLVRRNFIYKVAYIVFYAVFTIITWLYKYFCKIKYKECRQEFKYLISFSSHFNDLTFVSKSFAKNKNKLSWSHGAIYSYLLISDGFINLYNKIKNIVVLVDDAQEEVLSYDKHLKLNIYKLYNPTFVKARKVDKNKVLKIKQKYGKFLIMVSRFEYPHKDHFTVIKAFENLILKYKMDLNLVFIGTGPDEERVKKFTASLDNNVKKRIHFLGTKLDVQNYYASAYLLVHASVAGEGLPTVMIEAMNYQLPEVVTDSKTGPREILGNNEYGFLCKVKDVNDMSQKIYLLCENKKLYKHYQEAERERLKDFTPQVIKTKLGIILESIDKNEDN